MDVVERALYSGRKHCLECGESFAASFGDEACPHDGATLTASAEDPLVGKVIANHYKVVEQIGIGGWAVIYKAEHLDLKQPVAIKILHSHLAADPDKVSRFKQEAKAATRLRHQNVCAIYDYGLLEEQQPYTVMEFVDGITLKDLVEKEGKLPAERAIDLSLQICAGLQTLHEAKIIHRDLKPSNVLLVSDRQQVKIVDLGLAKVLTSDPAASGANLTQTGQSVGTPTYMSPEQCLGKHLDERSDLYALGLILCELLNGKPPFSADNTFELMFLHVHSDPQIDACVPADLQFVIMKLLEKQAEERFSSAADTAKALIRVRDRLRRARQTKLAVLADRAKKRMLRTAHYLRRRRIVLGVLSAVLSALILLVGLILFTQRGQHLILLDYLSPADEAYKHEDFATAEWLYRSAVEQAKSSFPGAADLPLFQDTVLLALDDLAEFYDLRGNHEQARACYQQALSIRERELFKDKRKLVNNLRMLAKQYKALGDLQAAGVLERRAQSL